MKKQRIGIVGNYIPEEIFHAAGLETILVTDLIEPEKGGNHFLPVNFCMFCRNLESRIKQLSHQLNGIVFSSSCTAIEKLFEIFLHEGDFDFVEILDLPKLSNENAVNFYGKRLHNLKRKLEKHIDASIESDKIRFAVKQHNRFRKALRDKNKYRPLLFKNNSLSMENIEDKISFIENMETSEAGAVPKLMVYGSEIREDVVHDLIRAEGGHLSILLTDNGLFYNETEIDETEDNLFESLARGYLNISEGKRNIANLPKIKSIQQWINIQNIDGILALHYPFCAKVGYDIAWLKHHQSELDVPILNLQIDNVSELSAGEKNRVAAFVEFIAN